MSKTIELQGEGFKPYNIVIEKDYATLLDHLKDIKDCDTKICIITDSNVEPLHGLDLRNELLCYYNSISIYTIEAGEEHKNLDTVSDIYANLIQLGFNRSDLLIALGGGVVGDITGFAAATYMRGIDFVQVPTTLLSQVDSSVGGKTGVDYNSYKNMVGAFYQPRLVYINTALLRTLPQRQLSAGMGEIIKYGLIYNKDFFDYIRKSSDKVFALDDETLAHIIFTSCDIKKDVVSQDPTEKGLRAILNYGHTFGHAIEKLMGFNLLHGECISIGIAGAAYISLIRGLITQSDYDDILDALKAYKLPIGYEKLTNNDIMRIARHDKKASADGIKFILIDGIGKAFIDKTVTEEEYNLALDHIRE
ncbi:MAG: 3-dehydroquinate synthase [Lachnospiraceae bacterium]|nr:3-dehydroquinate synthase [Lachnospiraceae bacterium]